MKLIILGEKSGSCRHHRVSSVQIFLLALTGLLVFGLAAWSGYRIATQRYEALPADMLAEWRTEMATLRAAAAELREQATDDRQAFALRLATLQARLVRLDALGERLTGIAGLDQGEFDFSRDPALGGPDSESVDMAMPAPDLNAMIEQLDLRLADREDQLRLLEGVIRSRHQQTETYLAGRPVAKGWMSSGFGRRTDPFHGGQAWHQGVDFAGREGSDIVAVAAGVVTWSGARSGYGDLVEISHPDGYVTRYAHNRENLVAVGDIVKKGQVVARMGSTGRSTGPHVHFEVLRNGKAVDPAAYIYRASL